MEKPDCTITKENLNGAKIENLIRLAKWLNINCNMIYSRKSLVKIIWYKLKREKYNAKD